MSAETQNLKLKQPSQEEHYDIGVFNTNSEIIDAAMSAKIDAPHGPTPGPVTNVVIGVETWGDNIISLNWEDPSSNWLRTVVVRKTRTQPTGPTDGVVICDNGVRNAYSTYPFFDVVHDCDGFTYWYAIYTLNESGNYSKADAVMRSFLVERKDRAKRIWTGVWKVGQTISLPDVANFGSFKLAYTNNGEISGTRLNGDMYKPSDVTTHFRGGNAAISATPTATSAHFAATSTDGKNFTLTEARQLSHTSNSGHSSYSVQLEITGIWGV